MDPPETMGDDFDATRTRIVDFVAPEGDEATVRGRRAGADPNGTLPRLYFPATSGDETAQVVQFRLLRERLVELKSTRLLLVTSPEEGEGKTSVAANLALCLAEFGRSSVLLVEANFRHPVLGTLFALPSKACFADQLIARHAGGAKPLRLRPVTAVPGESLFLLGVASPRGPRVSVAWPAFLENLDELRAQSWLNYIVIDGPPALGSADAKLIAQKSDGVLLTAVARRTPARKLADAAAQLAPASVAGVVLLT